MKVSDQLNPGPPHAMLTFGFSRTLGYSTLRDDAEREDFAAVLFLSLVGLDFSLWALAKGFFAGTLELFALM